MLRVVVSVVLALALLGISQPAIEQARETAAERAVVRELARVETAIAELRTEDAVPYGQPGARRVVTLSLPTRAFASAGVEYVSIGAPPDKRSNDSDLLASRVSGRSPQAIRVEADLRVERSRGKARWLADEPVLIRTGGRVRLVLTPVRHEGKRIIVVQQGREES